MKQGLVYRTGFEDIAVSRSIRSELKMQPVLYTCATTQLWLLSWLWCLSITLLCVSLFQKLLPFHGAFIRPPNSIRGARRSTSLLAGEKAVAGPCLESTIIARATYETTTSFKVTCVKSDRVSSWADFRILSILVHPTHFPCKAPCTRLHK